MRKFGVSSMLTRTHFHGNIEEMKKHTHLMGGPIHQADSLSIKEEILVTNKLMKKFMDLLVPIKTFYHGNIEETKKHIHPMVGLTHLVDSLLNRDEISLTRRSMKRSGDSLMTTKTHFHGNIEEMKKHIQLTDG